MAGTAMDAHRDHQHALVHADRLQPGRFPDHGVPAQYPAGIHQRLGSGHGALFIGRGEHRQRPAQAIQAQRSQRVQDAGKESLHVGAAKAVETAFAFAETERIGGPSVGVERHCIGVTRQHKTIVAIAAAGDQVELGGPSRNRHHLAGKAEIIQPARKLIDDRAIAGVQPRVLAADRRQGHQPRQHLRCIG